MSTDNSVLDTLKALIARPSVTPEDAHCQQWLGARLEQAGFSLEHLPSGPVSNLWARRGTQAPLFVFCRSHRRGSYRAGSGLGLAPV